MTDKTPALPPPGGNPSSGWQILGQAPNQVGQDADGRTVPGVTFTVRTGLGVVDNVFVPQTMYDAANSAIQALTSSAASASGNAALDSLAALLNDRVALSDRINTIRGELGHT